MSNPNTTNATTTATPPWDLPTDSEKFWKADADALHAPQADAPSALHRLGAAPFPKSKFPFLGFLATVYDHVAAHAAGRARRRDESPLP
jgi:hypothetical protein